MSATKATPPVARKKLKAETVPLSDLPDVGPLDFPRALQRLDILLRKNVQGLNSVIQLEEANSATLEAILSALSKPSAAPPTFQLPPPVLLWKADSSTSVAANKNLLGSFVSAINPPCVFAVYVTFDTGLGNLNVIRSPSESGSPSVTETLNGQASPTTLQANFAYKFEFDVDKGDWVNFQYTVAAKPLTLRVHEIDMQTA